MKKIFLPLLGILFLATGCLKKSGGCQYAVTVLTAPENEKQALANYLTANSIPAVQHSSNLYYEIVQQGSGNSPGLCSNINVSYTARLTNGTVFDSQNNAYFVLGSLIEGWKIGLPLIQKGGKIKLYIPPTLGYGSTDVKDQNGNVVIPANSILIFDITLSDFQ